MPVSRRGLCIWLGIDVAEPDDPEINKQATGFTGDGWGIESIEMIDETRMFETTTHADDSPKWMRGIERRSLRIIGYGLNLWSFGESVHLKEQLFGVNFDIEFMMTSLEQIVPADGLVTFEVKGQVLNSKISPTSAAQPLAVESIRRAMGVAAEF